MRISSIMLSWRHAYICWHHASLETIICSHQCPLLLCQICLIYCGRRLLWCFQWTMSSGLCVFGSPSRKQILGYQLWPLLPTDRGGSNTESALSTVPQTCSLAWFLFEVSCQATSPATMTPPLVMPKLSHMDKPWGRNQEPSLSFPGLASDASQGECFTLKVSMPIPVLPPQWWAHTAGSSLAKSTQ